MIFYSFNLLVYNCFYKISVTLYLQIMLLNLANEKKYSKTHSDYLVRVI